MTTTLTIDKETREKAAKRAKADKLSVSTVARLLLRDYADGKISIGTRVQEPFTSTMETIEVDEETQSMMDDVFAVWNNKKKWK